MTISNLDILIFFIYNKYMDIKHILKDTILKTACLKNTFIKKHPHTKYTLNQIINEILYVLRSGVSWNMYKSNINSKTLYYYFSKFVK